jgi:hypothetical protein
MGMEQTVTFTGGMVPGWAAVQELLTSRGWPVQMRMIDGLPAFADEPPPEPWRELRVGAPGGMITLRREADRVLLITWGDAEAGLRQAWNALTWALAEAGAGRVLTATGPVTAAEYRRTADLPASLRP